MRWLLSLCLLTPLSALADILPAEVGACQGKAAGAACTTPEGAAGTCAELSVTRPDYSGGVPPKYKQVKMLGCVATTTASARVGVSAAPWLGLGLAFLATVAALRFRPRRPPAQQPT